MKLLLVIKGILPVNEGLITLQIGPDLRGGQKFVLNERKKYPVCSFHKQLDIFGEVCVSYKRRKEYSVLLS